MEILSDRLKFFVTSHTPYKSIREFEREIGWKSSVVNNLGNGISADRIRDLREFLPNLNIDWLLTGKGVILKDAFDIALENRMSPERLDNIDKLHEIVKKKKSTDGVTAIPKDGYMMVEFQDLSVAAGVMGGANPDLLPDTKRRLVPHEFENGNYLVVRVDGDSMDDGSKHSIPDGCEILIKEFPYEQGQPLPIRNNLFVIVTRDGTVFKQITKHDTTNEFITLHSYNNKYKDYDVSFEDILQIFIFRKITSNRPPIKDFT